MANPGQPRTVHALYRLCAPCERQALLAFAKLTREQARALNERLRIRCTDVAQLAQLAQWYNLGTSNAPLAH